MKSFLKSSSFNRKKLFFHWILKNVTILYLSAFSAFSSSSLSFFYLVEYKKESIGNDDNKKRRRKSFLLRVFHWVRAKKGQSAFVGKVNKLMTDIRREIETSINRNWGYFFILQDYNAICLWEYNLVYEN